jgi:hypothetical protein
MFPEAPMSLQNDPAAPVTVLTSNDPGVLAVAQSLLEDAGIDFFIAGESVSELFPGGAVGPCGAPEIRVAPEDAEQASELLKALV